MNRMLMFAVPALALPVSGPAQEQQAGNAASTNTEETFQALIEQCDDTDALMLRARIHLQLPRTTEKAAVEAQTKMDEALTVCGEGDPDGAKLMLQKALKIAEVGATENFGTDAASSN